MPFLLLLLLAIALLGDSYPQPYWWENGVSSLAWPVLGTWGGVIALALAALVAGRSVVRGLRQHPENRERIWTRFTSFRFYHFASLFVFYGVALHLLGWGWAVQALFGAASANDVPSLPPGAELLVLAPFFASLVLSWAGYYRGERALHETGLDAASPFWSLKGYLLFHLRQNLALVVAPLGLIVVLRMVVRSVPDDPRLAGALSIGLMAAIFASLPWVLRLVLRLKPLPAGPLRDRLEAAARRLRFRYSNILLWDTNGGVANAMVAGILPFPRYVLLTDRLIAELTPEEVEAVFGHEVGHVRHGHMVFYIGFLILSMLAVLGLYTLVGQSIPALSFLVDDKQNWMRFSVAGVIGTYVFVVFGFLSRRCERQADVFGCRAVSCTSEYCLAHEDESLAPRGRGLCPTGIRTFISALEKVATLNGINRSKPGLLQSWQHSTIARRVEFLQRILDDPRVERRFQRMVGRVKWGLLLGVISILGIVALLSSGS